MAWTRILFATLVSLLAVVGCLYPELPEDGPKRPNILLIVADDLGYSDLGAYGSEIPTPNLDALAISGLRATDFYVASRGAPSRAMLLTGVDNHAAGFGTSATGLTEHQKGRPGYELRLNPHAVTVSSLLREAGYGTVMAGKWELGETVENRPAARGFERSFVLHDRAASHWSDMRSAVPGRKRALYTRNGEPVDALPDDYFSSRYFTDFTIAGVEAVRASGRPFFAYLSFQAPHGPLAEAPTKKFDGAYDEGYEAVVKRRLRNMKYKNLLREEVKPHPGLPTVPRWSALSEEQRRLQSRKMELYASMVANMDFHIGRLLDRLRELGEFENTLIVFLSDNGPEPGDRGLSGMGLRNRDFLAAQFPAADFESWGRPGSFVEYGPAWAEVSSSPYRLFKGTQAEGGIRSPLIATGPGVAGARYPRWPRISRGILHVTDLAPTFLELADVAHPTAYAGRPVAPLRGRSLLPHFAGGIDGWRERDGPHDWLAFGFEGHRAIRRDRWKLVWMPPPWGISTWRLYRLDQDPSELWDRAADRPERRDDLIALWDAYAAENGVVPPEADEGAEAQKSSPSDR